MSGKTLHYLLGYTFCRKDYRSNRIFRFELFVWLCSNDQDQRQETLQVLDHAVCLLAVVPWTLRPCVLYGLLERWQHSSFSSVCIIDDVFFVLLGVAVGVYIGSYILENRKFVSIWIPAISSSVMTLLMYIAEMFLINGDLYSFGSGLLFDGLPGIVFATIDLLVILLPEGITALIFVLLNKMQIK